MMGNGRRKVRAMREQARRELESLGYDELTPGMVDELVDKPVLSFRVVPLTQNYHTESLPGLNEYIGHLEKALKVQRRLRESNWYELTQKFGAVGRDFEGETLSGILDAAKRHRDRISPPKAGKNALRSDMAGKRVAIGQIANICRRNNITISSSTQSKFYCIVRAICGSVSPDTIRAATRRG